MDLKLRQHKLPRAVCPTLYLCILCLLYFSNYFVLKTILGIIVWYKILATHGIRFLVSPH